MFKALARALAAILALFAVAPVAAQQMPSTAANTVWGRIGVPGDTGPSQQIPFATLQSRLAGTQPQNSVFAGPSTGGSGFPAFRPLVAADVPPASAVPPVFNTGRPWCDITAQGAVGGNKVLDTTGFVACLTLLNSTYGGGIINIPPTSSGSCFFFGPINATGINNITVKGSGPASCIVINGKDSANIWFDLSGSNEWKFEDISIKSDGSTIPNVAILWACTGIGCATSGVLTGLTFNNVGISAATTQAVFYGYGFGNVSTPGAHGSLSINNSTWTQTNNGSNSAVWSNRNSVVHLTATNDLSVTSANRTIATSAVYSWGAIFNNVYLFDQPGGFVAPNDNNTAIVLHNISNFLMNQGALLCLCDVDLVITSNMQGSQFNQVQFLGAGGGFPNYYIFIGEGLNTFINFQSPFFSTANFATIQIGPAISSTIGGVWFLNITNPNAAGNPGTQGFIYSPTCGGFTGSNNWIVNSFIQEYAAGSGASIWTCGSIDTHTIIQGAAAITLQGVGAVNNSHPF